MCAMLLFAEREAAWARRWWLGPEQGTLAGAGYPELAETTAAQRRQGGRTGCAGVSVRGLESFGNVQGVGFYVDDVQNFDDASSRFGDVQRIEVLKGPQDILYAATNIGGAVKCVFRKRPDPEEVFRAG